MNQERERSGTCLCGAVRIVVDDRDARVAACHCGMCRHWGGGPLLWTTVKGAIRFEGIDRISVYRSSEWAERGFCQQCGSHLFYRLREDRHYELPVGLFPDGPPWHFAEQIFIDEKPAFYDFANDTPKLTGREVFDRAAAGGDEAPE